MATKTFYVLATGVGLAATPNWWSILQDGGSAPTGANTPYGYTPSSAAAPRYLRGRLGASAKNTTTQTTSYNTSTLNPNIGTSNTLTTAGDCFATPTAYSGTFAATAWTFNWNLRATTATATGHVNMQVWAATTPDGLTGVRQLTSSNLAGTTVTMNNTTSDFNSAISWSPGAITLNNEYLFFQVEWQETTTGSTNAAIVFRAGTASITTPDFALPTGVQFDANAEDYISSNSYSASRLSIGAGGTNRALLVWVISDGSASNTYSAQWGAQNLTAIGSPYFEAGTGYVRQALGLIAPTTGNQTLSVVVTGGNTLTEVHAISLYNVLQTSVAAAFVNRKNAAANSITADPGAITSAAGDMVIGDFWNTTGPWSSTNQTNTFLNTAVGVGAGNRAPGAATVTVQATLMSAAAWSASGINVKQVPSGTTYSDSVAEPASAADAPSAVQTSARSVAEAATATDTTSAGTVTATSVVTEPAAATDTTSAGTSTSASVTEAASAADLTSMPGVSTGASITEAASASDTVSAIGAMVASVAEAASAADAPSAKYTTAASVTEAAAAADAPVVVNLVANMAVTEPATATDTSSAGKITAASVTEATVASDATNATVFNSSTAGVSEPANAVDNPSATAVLGASVAEAGAAIDTSSAGTVTAAAVVEPLTATDTASVSARIVTAGVIEIAAATDTATGDNAGGTQTVAEAANATDVVSVSRIVAGSVLEDVDAIDTVSGGNLAIASVVEVANASDTLSGFVGVFVTEPANAQDHVSAAGSILVASVSEAANAQDHVSGGKTLTASVTEAANATDTSSVTVPPPKPKTPLVRTRVCPQSSAYTSAPVAII